MSSQTSTPVPARQPSRLPKIRRFSPYVNAAKTMLGFLDVELPSGLVIYGVKVMVGPAGRRWLRLPQQQRLDPDGKTAWAPILEIADRKRKDVFDAEVLNALRQTHPELFAGEPEL